MSSKPSARRAFVGVILGITALCAVALCAPALRADDAPADPLPLFDGKSITGWHTRGGEGAWVIGQASIDPADDTKIKVEGDSGALVNPGQNGDLFTDANYGDALITCDLLLGKGGDGGLYLMGEYSLAETGAMAQLAPPGQWNHLEICFKAPEYDDEGKRMNDAQFVQVLLNGHVVLENVGCPASSPGGLSGANHPQGPLLLHGGHGAVAVRNLLISALPQPVTTDTYSGYFVKNNFEPQAPASYVVAGSQAAFDAVFSMAVVMHDESHRLPNHGFDTLLVAAPIKRGPAMVTYQLRGTALARGVLTLDYTATPGTPGTATFAVPFILSAPRAGCHLVRFLENGVIVSEKPVQ